MFISLDKARSHDLEAFIDDGSKQFDFDPNGKGGYFDRKYPEPPSDDLNALRLAIQENISTKLKVIGLSEINGW